MKRHALHVLIEDGFKPRQPGPELQRLMARFTDDFSMVGVAGQRLDQAVHGALFAGATATRRPGIPSNWLAGDALPSAVPMLRYREDQSVQEGAMRRREALAVLRQEHGQWRWLALHETASA